VTQIATFKTALDAYEVDNGYYPKGKNGLMDLIQQPRDAQNWRGPYIQADAIPQDPWHNDYIYECPGRHNPSAYDISSLGPPGDNAVIGNWTVKR
jgi:general secretion pathway protein G